MNLALTEQAKAAAGRAPALGLYVHVPFCASTCDFCAFYQVRPDAEKVRRYLEGVRRERELAALPPDRPLRTIFWGGGTPGLLAPPQLEQLAGEGGGYPSPVSGPQDPDPVEWTVELAPASVTADRLAVLKAAGVNRVSLGVQSFAPDWLDALGRQHTAEQVYRAHDRIRAAGFTNLNLDLMFALPGQTEAEWEADLREAVRLQPEHLSTYCLTFEEDTALWVKLAEGRVKLDPEREAQLYERTWDALGEAGYGQYEISNFARPGRECLHNVNTWHMGEWVGLGPSAASQFAGRRGRNVADLAAWADALARGGRAEEDSVALTPELLAEDALVFGLRLNAGVELAPWRERAPGAPWDAWDRKLDELAADGLLLREDSAAGRGDRVRLTRAGRLLADSIAVELTV